MNNQNPELLQATWESVLNTLGGPNVDRQPRSEISSQIPVTILSGFLGAGKTTLLCQLLESSPLQIVAIVNDVAAINIDATAIRQRNAETIEFENGCACCVLGSDLTETLGEIGARANPPDAILIEASGISDPMGIAQAVMNNPTTTVDGIVTLVDAAQQSILMDDPDTGPLFTRQLQAAHQVLLTKTDGVRDIDLRIERLSLIAPGRPIIDAGQLFDTGGCADFILGAATRGARPTPESENHSYEQFSAITRQEASCFEARSFCNWLDSIPASVYRVKGWVWLRESDGPRYFSVQASGRRWRLDPELTEEPGSQLVFIGRSKDLAFETWQRGLAECV